VRQLFDAALAGEVVTIEKLKINITLSKYPTARVLRRFIMVRD
jgi:hypothetical protein